MSSLDKLNAILISYEIYNPSKMYETNKKNEYKIVLKSYRKIFNMYVKKLFQKNIDIV